MLRRLVLVRTDISEERSASFNTLMKEALHSSETSVFTRAARGNIQEDAILHSHRRECVAYFTTLEAAQSNCRTTGEQ
jgi:hypothetical protein